MSKRQKIKRQKLDSDNNSNSMTSNRPNNSDQLSELPQHLIEIILSYLLIHEAAKTSILSKSWKQKWHTVPWITINSKSWLSIRQSESMVNCILNQHIGTIQKFVIVINRIDLTMTLQAWLYILIKNSIQDLSLVCTKDSNKTIKLPDNLFSCQQLRHLNLSHLFTLTKLPCSYKGFKNLVTLELRKLSTTRLIFESVISNCLLLENIIVKSVSFVGVLNMNVPKLKFFSFGGEVNSISFNSNPLLSVLSIDLYKPEFKFGKCYRLQTDNIKFTIPELPSALEELHFRWKTRKWSIAVTGLIQVLLSCKGHLRALQVHDFCFKDKNYVSALFDLNELLPSLHTLIIKARCCKSIAESESVTQFWESEEKSTEPRYLENQLRKMIISACLGNNNSEMRFIQYMLANLPLLKEIIVETVNHTTIKDVKKLLKDFKKKTSPQAQIKFVNNNKKHTWRCETCLEKCALSCSCKYVDSDSD